MNPKTFHSPSVLQNKLSKLKSDLNQTRESYQQALNINECLKPSLNLLNSNLDSKIKPEHDKLAKERKALYDLFSFDKKMSIKENYFQLYTESITKKHQLTSKLSKTEAKHKQLTQKSVIIDQDLQQTSQVQKSLTQDKIRLEKYLSQLQEEKFKRLSIKSASQSQDRRSSENVNRSLNGFEPQEHNISDFDSEREQEDTQSQGMKKSLKSVFESKESKSFQFHPDTFNNAHQIFDSLSCMVKPKSKEILNSLQKQLNPLKLNQIIQCLEEEIKYLNKEEKQKLLNQKRVEERKKLALKDKENHLTNKLENMKIHIKKFKNQKFPDKSSK